jgi:hypothetical protein
MFSNLNGPDSLLVLAWAFAVISAFVFTLVGPMIGLNLSRGPGYQFLATLLFAGGVVPALLSGEQPRYELALWVPLAMGAAGVVGSLVVVWIRRQRDSQGPSGDGTPEG